MERSQEAIEGEVLTRNEAPPRENATAVVASTQQLMRRFNQLPIPGVTGGIFWLTTRVRKLHPVKEEAIRLSCAIQAQKDARCAAQALSDTLVTRIKDRASNRNREAALMRILEISVRAQRSKNGARVEKLSQLASALEASMIPQIEIFAEGGRLIDSSSEALHDIVTAVVTEVHLVRIEGAGIQAGIDELHAEHSTTMHAVIGVENSLEQHRIRAMVHRVFAPLAAIVRSLREIDQLDTNVDRREVNAFRDSEANPAVPNAERSQIMTEIEARINKGGRK